MNYLFIYLFIHKGSLLTVQILLSSREIWLFKKKKKDLYIQYAYSDNFGCFYLNVKTDLTFTNNTFLENCWNCLEKWRNFLKFFFSNFSWILSTKEVLSFLCLFGRVSSKKTICDITFLWYFYFVLWNPHNTWIHLTNNMTYQLQQTTKLHNSNWIPLSEFQSLSWVISTTHAKIPISCSSGRMNW